MKRGDLKEIYNYLISRNLLMVVCLLLLAPISSKAQDPDETPISCLSAEKTKSQMSHNIFGEILGPSFGVGIGFDSRFKNGTPFGYRVGLSYSDGSYDDNQEWRYLKFKGVFIPLEINAIFGRQKSKFEVGLGVTPSILHRVYTTGRWNPDMAQEYETTRGNRLNILGTINLGYRYQRESGFFMRAGLTLCIGDLKCSPIDGVWPLPNISLGYTLKY